MDSDRREILYIQRAGNELNLAKAVFKLSRETQLKRQFNLKDDATFFSNVIINCYYCIFYSAKAFLYTKGIVTKIPDEHKKTLEEFEKFVISGEIDVKLLKIYKSIVIKADELLSIFKKEKSKRGKFTYRKLPQANIEPARQSLRNAEIFLKNINMMIRNSES